MRLVPIVLLAALTACEPEPQPQLPDCVELSFEIDSCAPLYQPTFDNVWTSSFGGVCDAAGGSCHGKEDAAGAVNGLVMSDPDGTHAALMGEVDGRPFVDVDDPACSVLMVRLAVNDDDFRMPPGEFPRTDEELCAIAKWMAEGAER